MTATQVMVGLGEIQALQGDAVFTCLGLGSGVAVAISDPQAGVAGVIHVMLPQPIGEVRPERPGKFAPTGVQVLVERLEAMGAEASRLKAAMVGGAQVIQGSEAHISLQIGARNAQAIRKALAERNIPLVGEDVGGHAGRNMSFDTTNGKVAVRMSGTPEVSLCALR